MVKLKSFLPHRRQRVKC